MKQLKKKVLAVLCALACFFVLTACSSAEEAPTLGESESRQLQEEVKGMLEQFMEIGDVMGEAAVKQYRDNDKEVLAAGLESYLSVKSDLGTYTDVKGGKADKDDDGYTVSLNVAFEKRDCEFVVILDKRQEQLISLSFNPVYTTGENMTRAALNTLMGMGTVFLVLIFISWLISCFRYIRMFEDKMNKKKAPAPVPVVTRTAAAPVPAVSTVSRNLTDDLELVAVITAAIAAAEGTSADGLVVRSIRRAPGSKWKRA